jgi:hypothetical protein
MATTMFQVLGSTPDRAASLLAFYSCQQKASTHNKKVTQGKFENALFIFSF